MTLEELRNNMINAADAYYRAKFDQWFAEKLALESSLLTRSEALVRQTPTSLYSIPQLECNFPEAGFKAIYDALNKSAKNIHQPLDQFIWVLKTQPLNQTIVFSGSPSHLAYFAGRLFEEGFLKTYANNKWEVICTIFIRPGNIRFKPATLRSAFGASKGSAKFMDTIDALIDELDDLK